MDDECEIVGGPEQRVIEIVGYREEWPAVFAGHAARIGAALGGGAIRVDHVGSTAVPGLAAKPIVDVQLSVADPDAEAAYLPLLERAGYELRVREPGHRMVRTPERDVHVHVCARGSEWERRHLLFRDWLRHDAADRALYEATKRRLAARPWPDTNAYADAKSAVIAEITTRAQAWRDEEGRRRAP